MPLSFEQIEQMLKRYKQGESSNRLELAYEVNKKYILKLLNERGVVRKNRNQGARELSQSQELEVVQLYLQGEGSPKIAARY